MILNIYILNWHAALLHSGGLAMQHYGAVVQRRKAFHFKSSKNIIFIIFSAIIIDIVFSILNMFIAMSGSQFARCFDINKVTLVQRVHWWDIFLRASKWY